MKETESTISRIGIVLSSIPGYSETFFRNKIKGLQNNGYEVTLFVDMPFETSNDLSCKIITASNFSDGFLSKLSRSLITAFKCVCIHPRQSIKLYNLDKKDGVTFKNRIKNLLLNQYLLNHDLDWLHFGYGMLANNRENVAEAIGSKMAVSFRGFDLYLSPLKHENCYETLFTKQVKYHVLSRKMKQRLASYNISEENIEVITPAIDINLFDVSKQNKVQNEDLKIVCISRLHWVKGVHYLMEALSILHKENIRFNLTIIGDGEERERLIFAAYQYGILNQIKFTGKLPQHEVVSYLNKANLYVQYSIQEGFGNAVLEAQSMGLPCVVSDADGLQENILHEKTGLVVPKRKPKALADAIKEIHDFSDEKKERLARFAIERVRNEFNLNKQNTLFEEFYTN